jgi:hypothetical protein
VRQLYEAQEFHVNIVTVLLLLPHFNFGDEHSWRVHWVGIWRRLQLRITIVCEHHCAHVSLTSNATALTFPTQARASSGVCGA